MIRRPPRSTLSSSSAASDVYKRQLEAYGEVVELAEALPPEVRDHPTVRQMTAFALNRLGQSGDDSRAIDLLRELINEHGPHPESLGLLGRVHKDRHERLRNSCLLYTSPSPRDS